MKESQLQKKVKKAIIEKYGRKVWYYHAQDRTQRGIIDIILSFYGMFVAAEIKKDLKLNPLTKLQKYNLSLITETGGFSIEADTVEILMDALDYINKNYCLTNRNR